MHRIDGPTAAPALPAPMAVSGTPGYFSKGDPTTSTPATVPTQDWCNTMQEEIVAVILWAGLTLDKANHGQLLAALQAKFVVAAGGASASGTLLAANGYRTSADGFKECWGTVSVAGGASLFVPLPIAHTSFFNVSLGTPTQDTSGAQYNTAMTSKTGLTGFTLRNWEVSALSLDWSTRGV